MKKHKYLFVACLSLFPIMVVAENDTRNEIAEVWAAANINKNRLYKGKVVDEKTSEPLVGATVKVKGSTIGTITDFRPYRCPVSRERKTRIYMCGVRGLYLMNFPNRLFWWTEWNVLFSKWICTKSKASRF